MTWITLIIAATLEVGGDAALRRGLLQSSGWWMGLGCALLVAYGLSVNWNRAVPFGDLMGLYIAAFFIMSQLLSVVLFGERPSPALLTGGALIVAGALVIQSGAR